MVAETTLVTKAEGGVEGFRRRVLSGLDACKINILWTLLLDAWNLSVWLMTCLLPAPHTVLLSPTASLPPLSLPLCYQPPTTPHPPTLCFALCHLSLPSLSVLRACVLAGPFESWCQIGGPSARWHRLSQWLEKESGEEERKREAELERKRGEKKRHSGLPAVAHTLPTLIRSSCFVFSSCVRPPPTSSSLPLSL